MAQNTLPIPRQQRVANNTVLIITGLVLIDSLHFVFARLLVPYLPPVSSAMFIMLIASAEVAVFAQFQGHLRLELFRNYTRFFLAIGFLVAASTALNYAAVAFIDPGTASLLAKATVVFNLGFGVFWLRERLTRVQKGGAAMAMLGVIIITFQPGDYLRLGSFMVLGSSFMYALHAALVKRYSEAMNLTEFFLFRLLSTGGFLLLFAAGSGQLAWPSLWVWPLLLLVGTVDVVISRTLYYVSLRKLKLSLLTIVMTLSPVVAVGWTLLLFSVVPTSQQLVGGLATLFGVALVTMGVNRKAVRG